MPVAFVYPLAALAEIAECFAIWVWWRLGALDFAWHCCPSPVRMALGASGGCRRGAHVRSLWWRLILGSVDVVGRRTLA